MGWGVGGGGEGWGGVGFVISTFVTSTLSPYMGQQKQDVPCTERIKKGRRQQPAGFRNGPKKAQMNPLSIGDATE